MIYVVEDDKNIQELIVYTLSSMVTETKGFDDASSFYIEYEKEKPDLIVLDWMLPDKDGLTLLKELRKQGSKIPILMLSAKGSEYDKVQGLNFGADDYLAKPFGAMELVARVNALLRRIQMMNNIEDKKNIIKHNNLEYDKQSREAKLNDEVLNLTNKELSLLVLFLENPNVALSRDQLLNSIWGYDYDGESRTVDVHVASLRNKLNEFGLQIETIRSFGYRFKPIKDNKDEK